MLLLYNIIIRLYWLAATIASRWSKKAKLWIEGRKNWDERLTLKISPGEEYIWMHCSSAGEFEQGKPLAESLERHYPQYKLLITFFSPSGYLAAKNYDVADVISYLPIDTKKNAKRFIELVKPKLAIFVKYEFWYHHLSTTASHSVPLLLVSAVFRKNQIFFKEHGRFYRDMLRFFSQIFLQDEFSLHLLQNAGISRCSIGGDTRFDRVSQIQQSAFPVPFIEEFIAGKKVLIAGSTWDDDEELLKEFSAANPTVKLILAPHEITESHLRGLHILFPKAVLYSSLQSGRQLPDNSQVLLVDSVGLLSRLYQHATLAFVGGGFTRDGIHNILEAAVWGKPVIFGPNYKKYREASELIATGGGFSVANSNELKTLTHGLLSDSVILKTAGEKAASYVNDNTGATEKILAFIQENRLLTKL